MKILHIILWITSILFLNCQRKSDSSREQEKQEPSQVIYVQPLGNVDAATIHTITERLSAFFPSVQIQKPKPLPQHAYYPARQRYKADSLLRFLSNHTENGHKIIGITSKDISTSKGNIADWGVMGLGYRPGNACVASTFRLSAKNKNEQLFKVCIHELGHTFGLDHCPEKTCYMRNAEGGNPTDEEKGFCTSCKTYLIKKGWKNL